MVSTEFNGFHGFGAIQTGVAAKKRIGSDSLNAGGIFQPKKQQPMVDSQVICFEMRGRSRIKFTLGRNIYLPARGKIRAKREFSLQFGKICLQRGGAAPPLGGGNFLPLGSLRI